MNMNDPLKLVEYEQYREALKGCGNMTYDQLQGMLEVQKNLYSFGNLLHMVIIMAPQRLIQLYESYIKGRK